MDEELIQKYGPGMSFYRAQIKAAQRQKRLGGEAVLTVCQSIDVRSCLLPGREAQTNARSGRDTVQP